MCVCVHDRLCVLVTSEDGFGNQWLPILSVSGTSNVSSKLFYFFEKVGGREETTSSGKKNL